MGHNTANVRCHGIPGHTRDVHTLRLGVCAGCARCPVPPSLVWKKPGMRSPMLDPHELATR